MLFTTQNRLGGLVAFSLLILLTVGCISDDSSSVDPVIPENGMESYVAPYADFSLENLRMDPMTLKMLADLRQASVKYHDIEAALEAGYVLGSECVSSPSGGMGFHYVNFAWVDGEYDPTKPEAILYEMDKNGQMKMVAVEFVVVSELWDTENAMIPYFGSQVFDVALAPVPLPFDNYQLHVWIWKNNPEGIFTKFNPNVKCN